MAIKMRGVLAVPGTYEKDGKTYIKTAEELRKSAERFPILPLTFGHTQNSEPPTEAQQIGTVSQKWSEEQQRVISEFWFHEEKMPDVLRSHIQNGEKIPISAWYLADSVDEDGTLHGMSYSHVAVLEGEDPVCPIEQCGAFVVAESNGRLRFVEHTADLDTAPKPTKEPEAAPAPTPDVEKVEDETPKTEQPAEGKPEVSFEQTPKEEVVLEPAIIIPAEVPRQMGKNPLFDVIDGKYVFVPQTFRQQQEKK